MSGIEQGLFVLRPNLGPTENPPTVNVTDPAEGATVSGTSVPVAATASDDNGVTQVEFFVDGGSIGVDTDGTDGWSASTRPARMGSLGTRRLWKTARSSSAQPPPTRSARPRVTATPSRSTTTPTRRCTSGISTRQSSAAEAANGSPRSRSPCTTMVMPRSRAPRCRACGAAVPRAPDPASPTAPVSASSSAPTSEGTRRRSRSTSRT